MNNDLGYYVTDDGDEIFSSIGMFIGLSHNQKIAIINFLSVIGASDVEPTMQLSQRKRDFFSCAFLEFGVRADQYLAYLIIYGRERVVADIKTLSASNMKGLAFSTMELWNLEEPTPKAEIDALGDWLSDLGMTDDDWCYFIEELE